MQVIRVRCRRCGKFRDPREFVHGHTLGYCWFCYEWHAIALDAFAGNPPKGCQDCGRTYAELEALGTLSMDGRGDVRFAFHVKDGIYQVLGVACGCSGAYERKRLDLYGDTPYGREHQLDRAK